MENNIQVKSLRHDKLVRALSKMADSALPKSEYDQKIKGYKKDHCEYSRGLIMNFDHYPAILDPLVRNAPQMCALDTKDLRISVRTLGARMRSILMQNQYFFEILRADMRGADFFEKLHKYTTPDTFSAGWFRTYFQTFWMAMERLSMISNVPSALYTNYSATWEYNRSRIDTQSIIDAALCCADGIIQSLLEKEFIKREGLNRTMRSIYKSIDLYPENYRTIHGNDLKLASTLMQEYREKLKYSERYSILSDATFDPLFKNVMSVTELNVTIASLQNLKLIIETCCIGWLYESSICKDNKNKKRVNNKWRRTIALHINITDRNLSGIREH